MERFSGEELRSLALELPDEIQRYKDAGDFEAAKKRIEAWLSRPVAEELKTRLRYEQFILEELPGQFPYTKEEMIARFKEKVPDYTEADLLREEEENLAEWIYIGGEKHYIHNLVRNVCDKDPVIRERLGLSAAEPEDKRLLREKIARIRAEGTAADRFRLRASLRIKDEAFVPGMKVKVHLPIPAEREQISDVEILSHAEGRVTVDAPDAPFRAVCFEDTLTENREFFVDYAWTVTMKYHDLWTAPEKGGVLTEEKREELRDALCEQYPHIRFSPYLRALAAEIAGEEKDVLAIARRIYDYITKNVKYSYMRSYSLIPDIPQYCARNLRGDCGVQALLFITLCRICGVPARWQSGLYTNPADDGPHDWAMFYTERYGWLFADLSFGGSAHRAGDEERRRFYFGNLDTFRMAANNAFQQEFSVRKTFRPNDPYDSQTGEAECETKGFSWEEIETKREMLRV